MPGMDAPRDRGAGQRVEQIVRRRAFGGGASTAARGSPAAISKPRRSASPGS